MQSATGSRPTPAAIAPTANSNPSRAETIHSTITPFETAAGAPLRKRSIAVLQINLGRRCNLSCSHCHVEAGPHRTEELSPDVCAQLMTLIEQFPQIKTVDLTGGAPEMNYGFRPIVEAARSRGKTVMVRSNLTIYFEPGYEDLPDYCAQHHIHIVASLPCYSAKNVDQMRGQGVFDGSIRALQKLNELGYGDRPELQLDLVYNPAVPQAEPFTLTPDQHQLEQDYKARLAADFGIRFNHLYTITNLPIGRTKFQLERRQLHQPYLQFLADNFNPTTTAHLMCRDELSIDYQGRIFDCDFNQMEDIPAKLPNGEALTIAHLLTANSLDVLETVQTAPFCYGCTAGSGSSCGGALV